MPPAPPPPALESSPFSPQHGQGSAIPPHTPRIFSAANTLQLLALGTETETRGYISIRKTKSFTISTRYETLPLVLTAPQMTSAAMTQRGIGQMQRPVKRH